MAFAAGKLKYRYRIRAKVAGTATDAGDTPETWPTIEATVSGGWEPDGIPGEQQRGDRTVSTESDLIPLRYRAGLNSEKRLERLRDATAISTAINSSITSIPIAAVLKFEGGNIDYIEVDSEIMRVTAGSTGTTLTVERGALGTTPASHLINAVATRIQKLEIIGVVRADESLDELVVRVKRDG